MSSFIIAGYVWRILGRGPKSPPPIREQPRKSPSWIGLNHLLIITVGKKFSSHSKEWRKFERNNKTTALNILFVPYKKNTSKQNTKKANNKQDNTKKANNKQDNTKKQNNERDNTKEIRQAYISKHNDERDNQVNLLMITDGTTNWHFLQ